MSSEHNQVSAHEEEGSKIFVGNLDFKVTDNELASYFSAVGKVTAANVIRRGNRSMGYGFVLFESEEDALTAQNQLNKKEFNGREINVEMAKARSASVASSRPRGSYRGRGGYRGRGRGGYYGGNFYDYRYPRYEDSFNPGYGYGGYPRGRGGFRGGRGRGGRGGRINEPRKTGEASRTTLFIANLPFSMKDEGLAKLFEEYSVSNAHVITLRNGRSKGYGFVEFSSEAEQQRALLEKNNIIVENRPLAVKIALNLPEENLTSE